MSQPAESLRQRLRRVHLRLSGNLDRAEPLPPPAGLQARLLPVADLVMAILYSRSRAGSLRSVRVTLTTIGLSAAVCLGTAAASCLLILHAAAGPSLLSLLAGLATAVVAFGSGSLAVYGLLQRWSLSAPSGAR